MSRSTVKVGAAKLGAVGFLAIALGCAALAAFALGNSMKSRYSGARVVSIVVAKGELKAGTPVTADTLELRDWPEDNVPVGAFGSVEELLAAQPGATLTVGIL